MATNIIHPSAIETELERIWDSLQGTNKMRACLFNLIIYTMKNERRDYLIDFAKKVIQRFPSRIIFVTVDETPDEEQLKTGVSVMTADERECSIVCDYIDIEASGKHHARVLFVVLPHILPDLPVYLVFANDPCKKDPVERQLESFATRTIYDSETTESLPCFANALFEHIQSSQEEIADLNWARIEGWRSLLADTFHTSEKLECLKQAVEIEITFNSIETTSICHTRVQAVYLQGWLACQLGWTLKNVTKDAFEYEQIIVKLTLSKMESIPAGRIISLEIKSSEDRHFAFKRSPDNPHHIQIQVSSKESCMMPSYFIFDRDESGQSLVREICHKGTSQHYLALLTMLSKLDKGVC